MAAALVTGLHAFAQIRYPAIDGSVALAKTVLQRRTPLPVRPTEVADYELDQQLRGALIP